jgi:hypothetical protein
MTKTVATDIQIYKAENGRYRLRMTDAGGKIVPARIGRIIGARSGLDSKKLDAALDAALSRNVSYQQR